MLDVVKQWSLVKSSSHTFGLQVQNGNSNKDSWKSCQPFQIGENVYINELVFINAIWNVVKAVDIIIPEKHNKNEKKSSQFSNNFLCLLT